MKNGLIFFYNVNIGNIHHVYFTLTSFLLTVCSVTFIERDNYVKTVFIMVGKIIIIGYSIRSYNNALLALLDIVFILVGHLKTFPKFGY